MTLTMPVTPGDVRAAYPRETQGMEESEIAMLLRTEEQALRAQYRVSRTDTEADDALGGAMLAAWPAFLQQVRGIAAESVGTDGASVSYGSAGGFRFPGFLAAMLSGIADGSASTIRLHRA